MKKLLSLLLITAMTVTVLSCKKKTDDNTSISGDQSPMGVVGTIVNSTSATIEGVSNFQGTITKLSDGVSTYSGSATVTNQLFKNMLANVPQIVINGDNVSTTSVQAKSTVEGIESIAGLRPGIIVKYASEAGDTYPIANSSDVRTVVSKSTTDDYPYGFYLIKVMKIEEPVSGLLKSSGLVKMTYWANHRFGLVGVQFDFNDGTSAKFPLYTSSENP